MYVSTSVHCTRFTNQRFIVPIQLILSPPQQQRVDQRIQPLSALARGVVDLTLPHLVLVEGRAAQEAKQREHVEQRVLNGRARQRPPVARAQTTRRQGRGALVVLDAVRLVQYDALPGDAHEQALRLRKRDSRGCD